jgi:Tfp pilus assembly protein PilX
MIMRFLTSRPGASVHGERGAALIGVLLLLMMMSALVAALTVNSQTETFVARNTMSATQAQLSSEAGLNHVVQLTINYIFEWKSHNCGAGVGGVDAGVAAAVNTFLAGPGATTCDTPAGAADDTVEAFLAALGAPANTPLSLSSTVIAAVQYETVILDDTGAPGEDMDDTTDTNGILVIRSTGRAQDGTKVVLEALISPSKLGAIVADGDLVIDGNVTVTGPAGDTTVHTNANLTFDGSTSDITGNVTATGDLNCDDPCTNVSGTVTSGATPIPVPEVHAEDYKVWANYILTSSGTLTDASGSVICTSDGKTTCNHWAWDSGSATWSLNDNSTDAGTYYVEGNAMISGSPGNPAVPAVLSIVAEGSISITGSPRLAPHTTELLFVTNEDLKILGTIDLVGASADVEGQMLVRGQADIGGNATLDGQLIINDEPVGSLVTSNSIHGNASITYSGGLGTGTYTVSSWRDVRDAD